MINTKPLVQAADDFTSQAAQTVNDGLRSTQQAASKALNTLSDTVSNARERAAPAISKVAGQVESLARRSIDAARDSSRQLRDTATRASDTTIGYVKDEPVKSILVAAATGAALMVLFRLITGPRDRY